jgi:hypothetical protein
MKKKWQPKGGVEGVHAGGVEARPAPDVERPYVFDGPAEVSQPVAKAVLIEEAEPVVAAAPDPRTPGLDVALAWAGSQTNVAPIRILREEVLRLSGAK